jgi:transcriptional/translational regulatory protein YebC/TACO1
MLSKNNGSFAATGAATWAFTPPGGEASKTGWIPKHKVEISEEDAGKLDRLLEILDDQDDVQDLYTNAE